jgi:hypothetical protein
MTIELVVLNQSRRVCPRSHYLISIEAVCNSNAWSPDNQRACSLHYYVKSSNRETLAMIIIMNFKVRVELHLYKFVSRLVNTCNNLVAYLRYLCEGCSYAPVL